MRRLLAALLALASPAAAGTIYVDANLTSGANDGSSWADALQGPKALRTAVGNAVAGDRIFVAQGVYVPANALARTASITLASGVEIYGSFQGGEAEPEERPPFGTADSILTGDLLGDDGSGSFNDNSFHLVKSGTSDATAVLDGFVLTAGNANGGTNDDRGAGILCTAGNGPTVRNCRFVANRCTFGGGAGYINGTAPSFVDCTFEDNLGGSFGGAFDIAAAGAVRFERCTFRGNSAARAGALEIFSTAGVVVSSSSFFGNTATGSGGGGGLWIGSGSSAVLQGCSVAQNVANGNAVGGVLVQGSTATIVNGILWANQGQGGAHGSANQISASAAVTYSIVEGGFAGTGNLSSDPLFVDLATGNLALALASPAIDAGDNAGVPAEALFDVALRPRRADEPSVADTGSGSAPIVDMGAHEYTLGSGDLACVPLANSSGATSKLTAFGSVVLAQNDLNLVVVDLPANVFAYFLMSESRASLPVGSGVLCLGPPVLRFNHDVLNTGTGGAAFFSPDLTQLPQGQVVHPGETWRFQLWHRDGVSSNFSSSLAFTWE